MSIYRNKASLILMIVLMLTGCSSLSANTSETKGRCTEWRDLGPPAKSSRIRVTNGNCEHSVSATTKVPIDR